jgi:hypothetical protein
MRILRKAIVLGFAGLGVYKAWELTTANLDLVRERTNIARKRIEPALVEAESNLKDAVTTVADAVNDAADDVAATDLTSDAGQPAGTIHSASRTA